MAIEFARARFISRSKGGNAVRSAAYNMRDSLYSERTGLTYTFQNGGTLAHHEILLPDVAGARFSDPSDLWNAVEAAEHRKDSQVAFEVVLALPADREIDDLDRLALARGFALENFVRQGLAVQLDIHKPHSSDSAEATNHHAHLLITTRRVEGERLAVHKARDLHPQIHRIRAAPVVTSAQQWGAVWRDAQNTYFEGRGKPVSVDPVAPIPGEHVGPVRFRRPHQSRQASNEKLQTLNSAIVRNSDAAARHLHDQQRPFDQRALSRFLTKHIPDPQERASVQTDVQTKLHNLRRSAIEKATHADMVPSGWRQLFVEDVAREISPEYRKLVDRAAKLRAALGKGETTYNRFLASKLEKAQAGLDQRLHHIGFVRRILHKTGILQDPESRMWDAQQKGFEYGITRWSIRKKTALDRLAGLDRMITATLAERNSDNGLTLGEAAAQELLRRRRIALNAQEALNLIDKQDNVLRRSRPLTHAPPL